MGPISVGSHENQDVELFDRIDVLKHELAHGFRKNFNGHKLLCSTIIARSNPFRLRVFFEPVSQKIFSGGKFPIEDFLGTKFFWDLEPLNSEVGMATFSEVFKKFGKISDIDDFT